MHTYRTSTAHLLCWALLLSLLISGCASQAGNVYSSKQTREASRVEYGTIVNLAPAQIADNPSGLGTLGGAVLGGVAGSTIGGGRGRVLGALGGAVLGGLAGTGVERALTNKDAVEITVELENGQQLSVVQQLGDEEASLAVGDRVRLLRAPDGSARVRK